MSREVTVKLDGRQLTMRVPDDATSAQIQSFAEQHLSSTRKELLGGSTAEGGLGSSEDHGPIINALTGLNEAMNNPVEAISRVNPMDAAQYAPTAIRAAGDIGGNVVGGIAAASGAGLPLAAAAKFGIPAAADIGAQKLEEYLGQRPEGYNWKRTLLETGAAQLTPFEAARGAVGLARQGIKSGLAGTAIGELTGLAEGEQPTWTQRATTFMTAATIGAFGSKKLYSENLKQDAADLVRMASADEYAKTVPGVGEYIGEAPAAPDLPLAEATKATPNVPAVSKHVQEDMDELNTSHVSGPRETLPDTVKTEVQKSSPKPPPNVFGDTLQIEGPTRTPYNEGVRRVGGLAPMHEVVAKLDPATQQGVYEDWRALRGQHQKSIAYKDSILKDRRDLMNEPVWGLERIFKGTDAAQQEAYQGWLEAPDKAVFEEAHGFDAHDKLAVRHLRKNYNQMFQDFGIDPDTWLENYAPHVRKMDDEQFSVFLNDPTVPGPVKFFAEHLRGTEGVDRFETNGLKNAAAYLNLGSFKKFMGNSWDELYSKYSGLVQSEDPAMAETGQEMVDMLKHYRYRTPDRFGKMINAALNKTINGLSGGKFKLTASDILSTTQQLQTAALLSGRPMSAIRNSTQIIALAGSRLGPKWLGRGIQTFNTPEGKIRALPYTGEGMRDLSELRGHLQTPAGQALSDFNRAGMKMFTSVEEWGRGVVYNGQYLKTMKAAEMASGGKSTGTLGDVFEHTIKSGPEDPQKLKTFLSRSDIDVMPKAVRDVATSAYLAGDYQKAADIAADYVIQETLFDYGPLGRPPVLRKELGRTMGSFGVWPANYVAFTKNLATQGPVEKRIRDVARFGALTAASAAAIHSGKEFFGNEDQSLPWAITEQAVSPFGYAMGPPVSAWQEAGAGIRTLAAGRSLGYSTKQSMLNAATAFVPGSRAYKNFSDAYNDPGGFREKVGQLFEMSSDQPISRQRRAAAAFRRGITRF